MQSTDTNPPPRLFRTEQLAVLRVINVHSSQHPHGVTDVLIWTYVHKDKVLLPHGKLQFPLGQLLLSLVKDGFIEKVSAEYNAGYRLTPEGRNILDRAFDRRALQATQPTMQAAVPVERLSGTFGPLHKAQAPPAPDKADGDVGSRVIRMVTPPYLMEQVAAMMAGKKK